MHVGLAGVRAAFWLLLSLAACQGSAGASGTDDGGSSTSSEMPEADQRRAGISPGLVRLSIGYTGSVEQRWDQLLAVLRKMEIIHAVPV